MCDMNPASTTFKSPDRNLIGERWLEALRGRVKEGRAEGGKMTSGPSLRTRTEYELELSDFGKISMSRICYC
jgi:hypothetical protein